MATPEEAERTPRLVKILSLESYEDALHNVAAPAAQEKAASREEAHKTVIGEDGFRLRYLIELPLQASETMLDVGGLERPFDYSLEILTEEGPRRKTVDLPETFNWLYGLRVRRLASLVNPEDKTEKDPEGRVYRVVLATDREQKKSVLVVWRDMAGLKPEVDRAFLEAEVGRLEEKGESFDERFVNGDTAAAGFESLDGLFKRLMMAGVPAGGHG
jgi:adenine-specific DNA-methyltransferase